MVWYNYSCCRYWDFNHTIKASDIRQSLNTNLLCYSTESNNYKHPQLGALTVVCLKILLLSSILQLTIKPGTTLIYITDQAFQAYSKSLPGSKINQSNKLLEIPRESLDKMKSPFFIIGGVSYEFTPNAQLWPRKFNYLMHGEVGRYYSVINTLSTFSDIEGVGLIAGYFFMQRFYTAFDASSFKIGFATTRSTYAIVD
ncbi:eukaryotic aspartyl protease [Rhizoctonia solani 123E]|uniref:Eukaryotic aspartyl protease n=1 Tax=Rhizoctonia solani 123E TaxID=1423351 RepID=A0A074S540_9AGAM|nr:eukaryotic aspartyl protease [Rhizoctonia solani 123E]